jgi:hypothetical protein
MEVNYGSSIMERHMLIFIKILQPTIIERGKKKFIFYSLAWVMFSHNMQKTVKFLNFDIVWLKAAPSRKTLQCDYTKGAIGVCFHSYIYIYIYINL